MKVNLKQCEAYSKTGIRCKGTKIHGSKYCYWHGGK